MIDTRNLDPDAELRKFFGSKVIASAPSSSKRLIKTHLSKPRPTWPKAAMLGLGMRELTPDEVEEKRRRDGRTGGDGAERWFTLVHGGEYREAQRQFLGAVSSHGSSSPLVGLSARLSLSRRVLQTRTSCRPCCRCTPTTPTPSSRVRPSPSHPAACAGH